MLCVIIILINMYTVCTMLHLEFELNESVNVLIMINIWFVFVIHVYAKFCSKLWVRDKIVQMLCISIIWIINTAFMLFFFSLSFKQILCQKPRQCQEEELLLSI